MEILFIIIGGVIIFNLLKNSKEKKEQSKIKIVLYSILLLIPLYVGYYFLIAMVSGFIFSLFGEYMHYYGIILGLALSPVLSIITIFKINKKNEESKDE